MSYIKNNSNFDLNFFISKVSSNYTQISRDIESLITYIEKVNNDDEMQVTYDKEKVIGLPEELWNQLNKLIRNLKNETYYNSLFLITTAFLEYSLTELCNIIKPYIAELKTNYNNTKGEGLSRAKNYLKENLEINISEIPNWEGFMNNSKLRNKILHCGGTIIRDFEKSVEEQPDYNELKKNPNLDISESGIIHINNIEFIRNTLKLEIEFINSVFDLVKNANLKPR